MATSAILLAVTIAYSRILIGMQYTVSQPPHR